MATETQARPRGLQPDGSFVLVDDDWNPYDGLEDVRRDLGPNATVDEVVRELRRRNPEPPTSHVPEPVLV